MFWRSKLKAEIEELKTRIAELEDESGDALLKRLSSQAKLCNIDVHGEEYQTFMNRMFMDIAGRKSSAAKAYSKMAFVKDNPAELMKRAKELQQQASVITRSNNAIEYQEESATVPRKKRR